MCGRARQAAAPGVVARQASRDAGVRPGAEWRGRERYAPTHNLSPGRHAAVITADADGGGPRLRTMVWGLVPAYEADSPKPNHWKMFNARSETLGASPVFRRLLARGRCACPLDGFFEWTDDEFREVRSTRLRP